ncbi:MAG: acetyl-CoA decarbonylase/synthase complex subunit delta [Chloroflexota bacterium]
MLPEAKKTWGGRTSTVTIGATRADGGTRACTVTIGGSATLPFLGFEGQSGQPAVAMEIWDIYPQEWPDLLKEPFGDVLQDPVRWAQRCLELGADLICLRLMGCHPEHGNRPPEEAARSVRAVLQGIQAPLIIWGTGNADKDNEVFPAVAEAAAGENCLIGCIGQDNYKTLTAVCTAYKHKIIAESPCDVNIAKQVNILAQDMGFPVENIVINPTCAALGYGLEYIYSVMERARMASLKGDRMLAQPILCDVGIEAWGVKEARVSEGEIPEWGPQRQRAPLWEAATAVVYLIAGGDLLILRHPEAVHAVKKTLAQLTGTPAATTKA